MSSHEFVVVERKKPRRRMSAVKSSATTALTPATPLTPSIDAERKQKLFERAIKATNRRIQGQLIEEAKARSRLAAIQKEGGQLQYIRRGKNNLMVICYKADLTKKEVCYGAATFDKRPVNRKDARDLAIRRFIDNPVTIGYADIDVSVVGTFDELFLTQEHPRPSKDEVARIKREHQLRRTITQANKELKGIERTKVREQIERAKATRGPEETWDDAFRRAAPIGQRRRRFFYSTVHQIGREHTQLKVVTIH